MTLSRGFECCHPAFERCGCMRTPSPPHTHMQTDAWQAGQSLALFSVYCYSRHERGHQSFLLSVTPPTHAPPTCVPPTCAPPTCCRHVGRLVSRYAECLLLNLLSTRAGTDDQLLTEAYQVPHTTPLFVQPL